MDETERPGHKPWNELWPPDRSQPSRPVSSSLAGISRKRDEAADCKGCMKPIDPAFDSRSHDESGQAWHTTCWIAKVGAQDKNVDPDPDIQLLAISPAVFAGRSIWRRARRKT